MADFTAEQFAQRAFDLSLLDERQLDSVWGEFRRRDVPPDEFRNLLVRRELLTNYQVERLQRGERSGFFYGDHKILYLVGTGTFARVYRAVHKDTGKMVAVKVLRNRFSDDPLRTEQFLREGKMGISLRHPNIVPIYEVHSHRNSHFLVMEFVEGRNMRDFVKVRKKLEPEEATRLLSDVAAGLAHAFEKGITHRDIKMSNILISSRGLAKLVDFGLAAATAKLSDEALVNCPNPRTIDYAGLERTTGVRKDDPRSDIYFVGCIYYHMVSGHPPLFETKDRVQRLSVSRFHDVVPVAQHDATLPLSVVMIINKAMELNPSRRYKSPAAMLYDLRLAAKRMTEFKDDGQASETTLLAEAHDQEAQTEVSEPPEQHTVMIVESDIEMQNVFRSQLKRHGYRVLVFSDPPRAVQRFQEDEQSADCVVFSTSHLGGTALDGFNTFSETLETKNVPAILLLGEKQGHWKDHATLADHRIVLSMPIRMKQFRTALSQLLSSTTSQP